MDGLNEFRRARVAEILADFTTLQYYIAAGPLDPPYVGDRSTEGWRALRQCALDGQHILNTGADTCVPETGGGHEEQNKAELQQVHLDAFARRHQGQKIFMRQRAALFWLERRESVLQGQRPAPEHAAALREIDEQLQSTLAMITDEVVYTELRDSDWRLGRWTDEDPLLMTVQRWIRTRR